MMIKEFIFRPVGQSNENVLIEEGDGWPWAMIHVDLFHTPKNELGKYNDIYESIYKGNVFKVKMTLEIIE